MRYQILGDSDNPLLEVALAQNETIRLERGAMDRISAMLALEAGDIPVYMHIPAEKITLLCPRTSWCNGSGHCLKRLQDAIGTENVVLR